MQPLNLFHSSRTLSKTVNSYVRLIDFNCTLWLDCMYLPNRIALSLYILYIVICNLFQEADNMCMRPPNSTKIFNVALRRKSLPTPVIQQMINILSSVCIWCVQCTVCLCWQHMHCVVDETATTSDKYVCPICINPPGALLICFCVEVC